MPRRLQQGQRVERRGIQVPASGVATALLGEDPHRIARPAGHDRHAEDVAEWMRRRAEAPNCGCSPPAFLADPLQPGLWYMRYQGSVYAGRGARKDGPAAFLAQLERPAAVPPPPTEPAHDGEAAPPPTTTAAAAAT